MKEVVHELFTKKQVEEKIKEIAQEINRKYEGQSLHVIGVLKGGVFFFADLIRQLDIPVTMDFIAASSYGDGTESTGKLSVQKDLDEPIDGLHCLVVEDVIDSGNTLSMIKKMLEARNPASVEICTLLNKPDRRETQVEIEYNGFVIPDQFVVGYGLDYAQKYRNLPYIGVLEFVEE